MHCKSLNAEQALWNQTLKQAEITLGRKYPSQGPEFAACTVVLVCIDSCVPDWLNRRSCFEKLLCALEKRWTNGGMEEVNAQEAREGGN